MKEVYEFLKNAGVYYLATVEENQPRVRPFGTIDVFEDAIATFSSFGEEPKVVKF